MTAPTLAAALHARPNPEVRLPTYRHSGLPPAPHSPLERLVWVGLITPGSPPGHPHTRLALPADLVEPLREDLAAQGLLSPYQAPAGAARRAGAALCPASRAGTGGVQRRAPSRRN